MKPFDFNEFKAGKPAMLSGNKIEFIAYDEELSHPILCKETYKTEKGLHTCTLAYLEEKATMLPTKRQVWIAMIREKQDGRIMPSSRLYDSKNDALNYRAAMWEVIDAIPYEIEE